MDDIEQISTVDWSTKRLHALAAPWDL